MRGLDIVYGNQGKENDDLELGHVVSGPKLDVATVLDMPALYSGLKVGMSDSLRDLRRNQNDGNNS